MLSKHLDRRQRPCVPLAPNQKHQGPALYRDVGYGLRKAPSQRTRSFRMPIEYSNTVADFYSWDIMFMDRLLGGITIHKPLVPPSVVLALGNGYDFWAIHAAQKWPRCRITAHSLLGAYKDGMRALIQSLGLADRVKYVRGDPSVDLRLNYPSSTFDMVRLSYCSLNIAETEWYVFLQEINRILKPGGVLEVIDEDLLFPGRNPPHSEYDRNAPPVQPVQHSRPQSVFAPPPSPRPDSQGMLTPDTRSINVQNLRPPSPLGSMHSNSPQDWNCSEADLSSLQYEVDPLDHTKLAKAWQDMLTSRWISSSITSVLPFYLSAIFQDFRALPALEILISPDSTIYPSSSEASQQMIDPEPFRHLSHATVKDDAESFVTWMPARDAPPHFLPSHAPIHLARMVAIVASCKEAIWGAYKKLYGNDPRIPRLNDEPGKMNVHTIREEFELYWSNWDCDMRSRIDMASNTQDRLHWTVRPPPRPEPDSDTERWLKTVKHVQSQKELLGCASPHPLKPEAVRCVRGFVAWKFDGSLPDESLYADRSKTPVQAGPSSIGFQSPYF